MASVSRCRNQSPVLQHFIPKNDCVQGASVGQLAKQIGLPLNPGWLKNEVSPILTDKFHEYKNLFRIILNNMMALKVLSFGDFL